MVAAEALRLQKLDSWRFLAERFQFLDLVDQAADLGFFHLHGAEFDTLADRDPPDDVDDLPSIIDGSFLQLLERGSCSGYGSVDIVEQTVLAPRRVGCTRGAC